MRIRRPLKSLALVAALVLLGVSCHKDPKGICMACCDANGGNYCKAGVTAGECADINQRKVNGVSWTFAEGGEICPPRSPGI